MWQQIEGYKKAVKAVMDESEDRIHLICHSQGGLVCGGIVQTMPHHNIHTFVSLAAPQMGQYGGETTQTLRILNRFPHVTVFCSSRVAVL